MKSSITEAFLDESNGHHARIGDKLYADSGFLQSVSSLGHGYEVEHQGFGEFFVKTPLGEVEFNRMSGKEFPDQHGRSHWIYDTKGGTKAAEALVHAMQQKSLSTEVHVESKKPSQVDRIVEGLLEYGSASDFRNYRELVAKRAGPADCKPGHMIKVGDRIGWNPRTKKTQCASCWAKWKSENAEADAMERGYMGYGS